MDEEENDDEDDDDRGADRSDDGEDAHVRLAALGNGHLNGGEGHRVVGRRELL